MNSILRIIQFAAPIRHYIPEFVIYTIAYTAFGLFNLTMLIPLFDILFNSPENTEILAKPVFDFSVNACIELFKYYLQSIIVRDGRMYAILYISFLIITLNLLSNLSRYMSLRTILRFRINIITHIRKQLYEKIISQSLVYHASIERGHLISNMTRETELIDHYLITAIRTWLTQPIIIITYFSYLFYLSHQLTLFTIVFLPFAGYMISLILKKLRSIGKENATLYEYFIGIIEESFNGIKVIQSYLAEPFFSHRFNDINDKVAATNKKTQIRTEMAGPASEFLSICIVILLLMVGGYFVISTNQMKAATFIGYLIIFSQTISPLKAFVTSISSVQRGIIAANKIFEILDKPNVIQDTKNSKTKKEFLSEIELQNITFNYDSKKDAVNNLTLKIKKGESIALVGESGSGKSTISLLISRLFDPSQGRILIDGLDIKEIKLQDLRKMIAYVSQEAVLFNDSVTNNVVFGLKNTNMKKVKESIKIANAQKFVEQLPEKYNTVIGEKGMKLSGGERQRLTIARSIYKDAPILILDEATSALDSKSEQAVQKAIATVMKKKTSIIIAHRLSTIKNVDRIVVLENGKIVEEGHHNQLIQNDKGHYYHLVKMQTLK